MEECVPCVIAAWTILQGHLYTSKAEAMQAAPIPRSWVLWLNTPDLPQRALVTQLSLPPEICRHGARGSNIQADIYIYIYIFSTLFISSQPFLHAKIFTEHWRLCSQSAGLWVRAENLKWQSSSHCLCCLKLKHLRQKTSSIYIHLVICNEVRSPPKMRWIYNVKKSL